MHTVLAILKGVGITAVAAASFYGIYRLAKWRMGPDTPVVPGSGKGPSSGTPAAPK
jgi:hypothetical protein